MKQIYLDHAASTPVDPRVLRAMKPYFTEKFGNPGSLHSFGQETIAAVDKSRETIARAIGANFREIIFTGSATEANNLALRGALRGFRVWGVGSSDKNTLNPSGHTLVPRVIVSAIEHESVLETARDLESEGVEVIYLPVDRGGIIDLNRIKAEINERTVLISVMYANNEIGTIQPLFEIKKIIDDFKKRNFQKNTTHHPPLTAHPLFHTDAAQAFQFLGCDVNKLGVDLMTLSAHKIYGPKGVGALYVRANRVQGLGSSVKKSSNPSGYTLYPIITGGGQEFGLRSGTENTPLIVGFAEAVEIASSVRYQVSSRIAGFRDYFWRELKKICPEVEINGTEKDVECLPNILNVYFPGREAQFLLMKLDLAGVAASSGSACRSRALQSSYVIEALGYSEERGKRSIRFSFGRPTTKEEVKKALVVVRRCL